MKKVPTVKSWQAFVLIATSYEIGLARGSYWVPLWVVIVVMLAVGVALGAWEKDRA